MAIPTKFGFRSKGQCLDRLKEVAPKFFNEEYHFVVLGSYGKTRGEMEDLAMRRVATSLADAWEPEVEEFWDDDVESFRKDVIAILRDYIAQGVEYAYTYEDQ